MITSNEKRKRKHAKQFTENLEYIFDANIRPKDLRPDLHIKTHFKGTTAITYNSLTARDNQYYRTAGMMTSVKSGNLDSYTARENGSISNDLFLPPPFNNTLKRLKPQTSSDLNKLHTSSQPILNSKYSTTNQERQL